MDIQAKPLLFAATSIWGAADLLRSVCQCIVTEVTVIGFKTIQLVPLPAH
eukprot:SAG22_NODE_20455_length_265_cov_1.240964_1_plen_49_part_10